MGYFGRFGVHDTDNDLRPGKIGLGKKRPDNRIDQRYSRSGTDKDNCSNLAKCSQNQYLRCRRRGRKKLPNFNSDKQLLQTSSVISGEFVKAPWRTFEFDSCFRTIAPVSDNESSSKNNQTRVRGAFKNVISAERSVGRSFCGAVSMMIPMTQQNL